MAAADEGEKRRKGSRGTPRRIWAFKQTLEGAKE